MRISNKRLSPIVDVIYTLLIFGIVFGVLLIIIPVPSIMKEVPLFIQPYFAYLMVIFSVFLIYVFKKMGRHQFEYNSDGETITIRIKDPFWAKYFPANLKIIDFPKRKLKAYKVKRWFFIKRLDLYINTKRNIDGVSKFSFNIIFLTNKEIIDLRRSLHKIVQRNKENESSIDEEEDEIVNERK